jgi:hypothetical protein
MEHNYQQIIEELKRTFPAGTVKFRSDNERPYIPNQVYTDRMETATNSQWDREIKELEINAPFRYVKALVRIRIEPHFRDGYGFSVIDGDPATNPKIIATAVDKAVNEAILEAMDSYEMGWKDLAPYKLKDWAGNPALKHLLEGGPPLTADSGGKSVQSSANVTHKCIFTNCGKNLTEAEWFLLGQVPNLNKDKMIYCFEHLPKHMKRKLPESVLRDFEAK